MSFFFLYLQLKSFIIDIKLYFNYAQKNLCFNS